MQFVTIDLLLSGASLTHSALITLLVNARHLFYGITMAAAYRDTGRLKPYLAFSLTDETFAVLSILEVPEHISPKWFYFAVSFLHQLYWVIGSVLGGLAGMLIPWDLKGLDFSMTALFVVLLTEQWRRKDARVPVLIGLSCALIGRFLFGSSQFIFPAMLMIVGTLFLFRGKMSPDKAEEVR
jgi:4-azaleucine resistance transporter AzlC